MVTVSIISPRISMEAIQRTIQKYSFGHTFLQYVYERQEDINKIYRECREKCDILFFSGEVGYEYAIHNIPDLSLPCFFVSYTESQVLAILLNFKLTHPEIPLNRLYLDFLAPVNHYMNLHHYLPEDQMPYCIYGTEYSYENILSQAKALYEEGKIDYMLTRTTNNLPAYRKIGIPFQHFLPTDEMIADSIQAAIDRCMAMFAASPMRLVILIKLLLPESMGERDQELEVIEFHCALARFRKKEALDFAIERFHTQYELHAEALTPRARLRLPQDLVTYLCHQQRWDFRLGAGTGNTTESGRTLAENALREAIHYCRNDGFAYDSDGETLIGPLSMPTTLRYSYSNFKAVNYSRENGIDESNLLRLLSLFEMDRQAVITSHFLSEWLNITIRSCNRILQQLLDAGLILEIEQSGPHLKRGRPMRCYRFCQEKCRELFW